MYSLEELKSFLKKRLSKKRFIHSLNVADEAYKLAGMYGEDPDKAYLAGLLHDICKESPAAEQEELMLKGNMNISGTELASKALWHGPAGAYFITNAIALVVFIVLIIIVSNSV